MSAEGVDRTLAALADPARRRIVELLLPGSRRSGELADALGLPRPATSRHLAVLRDAGLVAATTEAADARVREYTLCPAGFAALQAWLLEAEGYWTTQLAAFAAHVERP
jgi:DNA-binding transcriptional ArsR family regulator